MSSAACTPAVNLGGAFVGVGVGVGEAVVGSGFGVVLVEGVGFGVGVGVGVGVGEGIGAACFFGSRFVPLFQTCLLPLLMQVYFLPLKFLVIPCLEQGAPGLGEGAATALVAVINRASAGTRALTCIEQEY